MSIHTGSRLTACLGMMLWSTISWSMYYPAASSQQDVWSQPQVLFGQKTLMNMCQLSYSQFWEYIKRAADENLVEPADETFTLFLSERQLEEQAYALLERFRAAVAYREIKAETRKQRTLDELKQAFARVAALYSALDRRTLEQRCWSRVRDGAALVTGLGCGLGLMVATMFPLTNPETEAMPRVVGGSLMAVCGPIFFYLTRHQLNPNAFTPVLREGQENKQHGSDQ